MPSKNVVKIYEENSYYHIYNRGVEKRKIFLNDENFRKFIEYLIVFAKKHNILVLSFCLMDNHYHLLVFQKDARSIVKFMHSLSTKYTLYFNYKYDRVGSLFQGVYKARRITSDEALLIVSTYIHINPLKGEAELDPKKYPYSSLSTYLGETNFSWVYTDTLKSYIKLEGYERYIDRAIKEGVKLGETL